MHKSFHLASDYTSGPSKTSTTTTTVINTTIHAHFNNDDIIFLILEYIMPFIGMLSGIILSSLMYKYKWFAKIVMIYSAYRSKNKTNKQLTTAKSLIDLKNLHLEELGEIFEPKKNINSDIQQLNEKFAQLGLSTNHQNNAIIDPLTAKQSNSIQI